MIAHKCKVFLRHTPVSFDGGRDARPHGLWPLRDPSQSQQLAPLLVEYSVRPKHLLAQPARQSGLSALARSREWRRSLVAARLLRLVLQAGYRVVPFRGMAMPVSRAFLRW